MNNALLKQSRNCFNWRYVYFVWPLEYLVKKHPVPTKRVTVVKVKSCSALLHVLLLCIGSRLIAVCVARGLRTKNMRFKLRNLHCCTCYRFW